MNNIVFNLMKGEKTVYYQRTSRKIWIAFFEGKSCGIPSVIIDDVDKFLRIKQKG